MLVQLAIRDIVLIDRLDIGFARGLERAHRGDGRGQIHPARRVLAGARRPRRWRRSCGMARPRPGDRRLRRRARTTPPAGWSREHDIPDEGDLILRRMQFADGRTRAFVNDQPVSVQVMRAIGGDAGRDPRPARRPRAGGRRRAPDAARRFRRLRFAASGGAAPQAARSPRQALGRAPGARSQRRGRKPIS